MPAPLPSARALSGGAGALSVEARALPAAPEADDRLLVICALVSGAGLIHVVAAFEHLHEYALYALFFALLAPAQVAWSLGAYRTRSRPLLALGALGCLLIVALWVLSRTTGLPIGPEPWKPEALGTLDVTATANELLAACLIAFRLLGIARRPGRRVARSWRHLGRAANGLALVLLLTTSLVLIGPHAH